MTEHTQSCPHIPVCSSAIDGDWLQAMPGERLLVRISSDETNGRYATLELVAALGDYQVTGCCL